jgi:hypothetical protein
MITIEKIEETTKIELEVNIIILIRRIGKNLSFKLPFSRKSSKYNTTN